MQLVPSPLFVVGTGNVGGGVRWQVTPLVYSFGVAAETGARFRRGTRRAARGRRRALRIARVVVLRAREGDELGRSRRHSSLRAPCRPRRFASGSLGAVLPRRVAATGRPNWALRPLRHHRPHAHLFPTLRGARPSWPSRFATSDGSLVAASLLRRRSSCGFIARAMRRNLKLPTSQGSRAQDPDRRPRRAPLVVVDRPLDGARADGRLFVLDRPRVHLRVGELSPPSSSRGSTHDLPLLAAVVVSHMHFDHLSYDSLAMIESKTPIVLLPPGAKSSVPSYELRAASSIR